ncbi:MAG TPA: type II CAAX endopeptidase family protein [Pyrinomonadaceae bacterium]|nr:type II CAAX endopeptidase family protein [Pyrinomonadaceae bacterium]
MRSLFINDQDQLRSGWRAIIFLFAFVFLAGVLGTIVQIGLATENVEASSSSSSYLIASALTSLIAAILVGWQCGKLLENLPFRALGAAFIGRWPFNLIAGLTVGAATIGLAVLVAYAFGGLGFEWNQADYKVVLSSLIVSFAVFAAAAAFEEALFRGYILQTLARSGYAWLAIALTSIVFGAVHLGNPDASLVSTFNTILAGVWFSVAYLKTRDLWFVWGLHLMWNWVQGSILGIEVSGMQAISKAPLLREVDVGPTWLTGETYGIEGGIACTVALAGSIAMIHFLSGLKPNEELYAMTEPIAGGMTKKDFAAD